MSKERITIDYVASGQPRPYADSRSITRVQFERTNPMHSGPDLPFEPNYMSAKTAEMWMRNRGIIGKDLLWKKDIKHGLESHIVYIKPLNPKKLGEVSRFQSDEEVSDIWEVYCCSPYCD